MFKDRTVFIVGAGASKEYGMPLGSELGSIICDNLTFQSDEWRNGSYRDRRADQLLRHHYKDDEATLRAIWDAGVLVPRGLPHAVSIDAFIDMHSDKPGMAPLGKLQIALEILRAERKSALFFDPYDIQERLSFNSGPVIGGWLRPFAEILLEKVRADDLDSIGRGLTIICFNYDRLIEHYLLNVFEATLGIDYGEAHALVSSLNIIHPYGSLGPLPATRGGNDGVPFGADTEQGTNIWQVVDRLSTFTEEMKDEDTLGAIKESTSQALNLIFLGFSFQAQNVELVRGKGQDPRFVRTLTTGVGIAEAAVDEVKARMRRVAGIKASAQRELVMLDTGCVDLLRQNRITLSQG